jgi:hypothetical protein
MSHIPMISSVSRHHQVVELTWIRASVFIGLCDFGRSGVKSDIHV